MLEITVCMTVLKNLLEKDLLIDGTQEEYEMLQKILQHKIVLSDELNESYMSYCAENHINVERLQQFLVKIINNEEQCRILSGNDRNNKFSKETNVYLRALKNACYDSKDRVLISEHSKLNKVSLQSVGIEMVRKDEMSIEKDKNLFTQYTFPITAYMIKENEDSKELAAWIGRILRQEKSFAIYDNYFTSAENIKNFNRYVLKYIPEKSDIIIVTTETENIVESDIVTVFQGQDYSKWNVEVYLVKSKKESHARVISTPTYTILLDRGLSTFGKSGKTFSSLLTIKKNENYDWYRRPVAKKIFP